MLSSFLQALQRKFKKSQENVLDPVGLLMLHFFSLYNHTRQHSTKTVQLALVLKQKNKGYHKLKFLDFIFYFLFTIEVYFTNLHCKFVVWLCNIMVLYNSIVYILNISGKR